VAQTYVPMKTDKRDPVARWKHYIDGDHMLFLISSGRLSVPRARLMLKNWASPSLPQLDPNRGPEMKDLWNMLGGDHGEIAQSLEPPHVSQRTGGTFN
jgi:hypothetical protein